MAISKRDTLIVALRNACALEDRSFSSMVNVYRRLDAALAEPNVRSRST